MTQIVTYKQLDKYLKLLASELGYELLILNEKQDYGKTVEPEDLVVIPLSKHLEFAHSHSLLLVGIDFENDHLEEVEKLCRSAEMGSGIIDLNRTPIFHLPLFQTVLKKREIDELIQRSSAEIQRIKRLHERLVPLRTQHVSGLKLFSKYIAGESSGGEFFDFFTDDKTHYIFMVSSSSYLATSHTISQFECLSGRASIDEKTIEQFLKQIFKQVESFEIPDLKFDFLLMKVDLRTMNLSGYNFGDSVLISSCDGISFGVPYENNIEQGRFEWKLMRGEKVVALSAGVNRNCKGFIDKQKIDEFILSNIEDGAQELLTELFFQLKRTASSTFLKYDASAIYIEVDKNVFIEV